ncbi:MULTISPECIES: ABC transporter ATP-binding protein [Paenibacillus]|uniref:ABC transporter ATP-binding protein n=1 Tax=Paenibacillus TaxID=44249 RepID=UPI00215B6114|nr:MULTISPECIES: ABC transporter ATP-binding protein [Paenibacillus]
MKELVTYHGSIRTIDSISFHVNTGEIVSIIGANGVGKSTLLGTLAGLYRPSQGEILLDGESIFSLPAYKIVRQGISLVPQGRQIFSSLSVRKNLVLGMYHNYQKTKKNLMKSKIDKMLEIFPSLKKHLNNMGGNLSGGEQQMLAIARGLMSDPKIILLDEPSIGLAPIIVREILEILQSVRDEFGMTVILVEQNVKAALKISDRAYIMDKGKFVLSGHSYELINNPMIQSTYLGLKT